MSCSSTGVSICSRDGSCSHFAGLVLHRSIRATPADGANRATSRFASKTGDLRLRSPIEITSPGFTMYDGMLTMLAVDAEVTMRDELARLRAARREVQAIDDVVETALEQLQERAAGLTRNARGLAEVVLELRFVHAVVAAHLLLLAQLTAVFGNLRARACRWSSARAPCRAARPRTFCERQRSPLRNSLIFSPVLLAAVSRRHRRQTGPV